MKKKPRTDDLLDHYHLLAYEECDSTNEEALRLAQAGAAHGAVIWAKQQTHGHGRQGRPWVSTPGALYASVLLRPECPLAVAAQLSFVASASLALAMIPLLPGAGEITLKWPNDVRFGGRKLGGVLLESSSAPNRGDAPFVIVGIGVNIDASPEGIDQPAVSLKEAGVEIVSAKIVLSRFIHHFCQGYNEWQAEGFEPIRKVWLRHAEGLGQPLRAQLGDREVHGIFETLDGEGALVLRDDQGARHAIHSGEIFFDAPVAAHH